MKYLFRCSGFILNLQPDDKSKKTHGLIKIALQYMTKKAHNNEVLKMFVVVL